MAVSNQAVWQGTAKPLGWGSRTRTYGRENLLSESKSDALPTWRCPNIYGTPERNRTSNLPLRRQLLYPTELLAHMVLAVGLEPTRYFYQRILSPPRLPIPSTPANNTKHTFRSLKPIYYKVAVCAFLWWGKWDLNPHAYRHGNLNPARLPIPPCPHVE